MGNQSGLSWKGSECKAKKEDDTSVYGYTGTLRVTYEIELTRNQVKGPTWALAMTISMDMPDASVMAWAKGLMNGARHVIGC
jgi:hypothetical protein